MYNGTRFRALNTAEVFVWGTELQFGQPNTLGWHTDRNHLSSDLQQSEYDVTLFTSIDVGSDGLFGVVPVLFELQ
jgi:hypothetical protein